MTKIQRPATPTELDLMLMRGGWPSHLADADLEQAAKIPRDIGLPARAFRALVDAAARLTGLQVAR